MLEGTITSLNASSKEEIVDEDEGKIAGRKLFLVLEQLRGVDDLVEDLSV